MEEDVKREVCVPPIETPVAKHQVAIVSSLTNMARRARLSISKWNECGPDTRVIDFAKYRVVNDVALLRYYIYRSPDHRRLRVEEQERDSSGRGSIR